MTRFRMIAYEFVYSNRMRNVKKAKLANTLNELMKQRSISARALSKVTGVPQSTLSHLLSGRSSQKPEHLLELAKYFGVSLEYLIFGEDAQVNTLETILTEEVFSGWVKIKIERAVPSKKGKL